MNQTKRVLYFILVVFSCLLFTTSAMGTELKLNTQDFPPFNYEINGIVSGPAADIIREVCKEMKISCSFKLLPWRRAQANVKKGKANALFVVGWNKERDKWLHFSHPIIETEYGFFVLKTNTLQFKQISDIEGYRVGVYGPSNTSKSLENLRDQMEENQLHKITIETKHDDILVFKMLNQNRNLDAVYSNRDVGNMIIKKLSLKNIRYAGPERKLKYYIAFSKQFTDNKVVDRFNAALLDLYKRGVIQNILKEHSLNPAREPSWD